MNLVIPPMLLTQVSPTFVQIGNGRFADGWVHEKTVPFAIIAMPTHGWYEVDCGGRTAKVRVGEAFMTRPGQAMRIVHHAGRRGGTMTAQWVHFNAVLFETVELSSWLRNSLKLGRATARTPRRLVTEMLQLAKSGRHSPAASLQWNRYIWELLAVVFKMFGLRDGWDELLHGPTVLKPVISHLHARLAYPITVEGMAKVAGVSASHLHHSFKRLTGRGPMSYLKLLRLNESARLLASSDRSVTDISLGVGFTNPFHFSREFKRQFHLPPSEYRQQHGLPREED